MGVQGARSEEAALDTRGQSPSSVPRISVAETTCKPPSLVWQCEPKQGSARFPHVRCPSSSELSLCRPHCTTSTSWSKKALLAVVRRGVGSRARFESTA